MKAAEAEAILDSHIGPMRAALGIERRWIIKCRLGELEGAAAVTHVFPSGYRNARILFDPDQHATARELRWTLRHELLHLFHSELTGFRDDCSRHVEDEVERERVNKEYDRGVEHLVAMIEDMLDGLGMTPERLVELGERKLAGSGPNGEEPGP